MMVWVCWHTCNISIWEVEGAKISVYRVSSRSVWPTWDLVLKMQKKCNKSQNQFWGKAWEDHRQAMVEQGSHYRDLRWALTSRCEKDTAPHPSAHEKSSLVFSGSLGQCPKPASVSESPRTFPEDIRPCVHLPRLMDWNFCTRKGSVAGNGLPICVHITATLCLHSPRLC